MRQLDFSPDPLPRYQRVEMAFEITEMRMLVWLDEAKYSMSLALLSRIDRDLFVEWVQGQHQDGLRTMVNQWWEVGALKPV